MENTLKEKATASTATFVYLALCVILYLMRIGLVAAMPMPLARMMY